MKKYFSLILVLVLAFAMAVSAFAEDTIIKNSTGSSSENVTAKYEEEKTNADNVAKVYNVTIAWKVESTIVYSEGTTTFTWNADATKYEAATAGKGWTGDATVTVTVTNKSNDDITAKTAWAEAGGVKAVATIDQDDITIDSAAKDIAVAAGAEGSAKAETVTVDIATPTEGTIEEADAVIGTVTVTIAPKTVKP